MLIVLSDNKEIETNFVKFSDGAITYKLDTLPKKPKYISISVNPRTPVTEVREELTIMEDCFTNHYCDIEDTKFILYLPYMGYARADRRFEDGNPFPLLGFMKFLNEGIWDEVHICDVHNVSLLSYPISTKLFNKPQLDCYKDSLPHDFNTEYDFVVSPDKGAINKARTIAEHLEVDIIYADKTRDISTGRITAFTLPDNNFKGCKVLIPDDICDFGGTFIGLAKELKARGAAQVDLYVTHLIGGKGLKMLDEAIDTLYYHHIVGKYINSEDVMNFNLNK